MAQEKKATPKVKRLDIVAHLKKANAQALPEDYRKLTDIIKGCKDLLEKAEKAAAAHVANKELVENFVKENKLNKGQVIAYLMTK